MAEETTIALKVEIGGSERAINSLKDLKAARKDLQNEMLSGNTAAAKSLAQLEDKFEDLKDSTRAVKGDGIEPLRNSFGLFKDGIMNFDMGKIGTAFKGLGAAMKAVPIFLLVEGITYLITNFKELSEGTGILAKVLQPIGELIGWITDGLYALTDAIGLTNTTLDKMGESTVKNAEASKEALSQQNAEYDRQIKVAKAAGESTVELEKAKQQAIIDTNIQIVKQGRTIRVDGTYVYSGLVALEAGTEIFTFKDTDFKGDTSGYLGINVRYEPFALESTSVITSGTKQFSVTFSSNN